MKPTARRCANRCWFAVGVSTGVHAPFCERCGRPNPRWSAEKQAIYEDYVNPRQWVRCYDIEGDPVDEGWAVCRVHGRVSVKTRGDRGAWHLVIGGRAASPSALHPSLVDTAHDTIRPKGNDTSPS